MFEKASAFAKAAHEKRIIAFTSGLQQFCMAIAADPEVARIYRDGCENLENLESVDQWRFGAMMQTLVGIFALSIEFKDISGTMEMNQYIRWILGRPGRARGGRTREPEACTTRRS